MGPDDESLGPPNLLLLITDQQRQPRHWPDESGWTSTLMPNDAELARTGLRFKNAFCNTAMCSPSRASLFTGRYPPEHGVTLTLTAGDLRPDPRNAPATLGVMAGILRRHEAPARRVLSGFARGAFRLGPSSGGEPELAPSTPQLATLLRARGYEVAYKGKWHLTHPSGGEASLLGGWTAEDAERLERDYGFAHWEPPDAGENAKAEHFGGGNAGEGEGWDEVYTRQAERWLSQPSLPEPFCLVVSLVNPHDVLGYPASHLAGGYRDEEFREFGVGLPPTIDESLRNKPAVHSLMRMGMAAYLGPLRNRRERLDYVNFYAYLHRVVDERIGRILDALGDPSQPDSLRSRTIVVRCADHGEMGLSHGGLRQKMFNAYEETINVPLVISNPILFREPAETDALASLVDVLPTVLNLAGATTDGATDLPGRDLTPILAAAAKPERERAGRSAVELAPVLAHVAPACTVQDTVHFTYDDHQAGTATQEAPGQPNRIRAIRTATHKYAWYYDPTSASAAEHEMYDLDRDPIESRNLVDVGSGEVRDPAQRAIRAELADRLAEAMRVARTDPGVPPSYRAGLT